MVVDPREDLFALLEGAVAEGVFPGCVAVVVRDQAVLYHEAHGSLASHADVPVVREPVRRETSYDLASLTKVLCTTTLAAIGVGEGWLELDAPVPERWGCPGATLGDLLEHCAGLAAHREYFVEVEPFDRDGVLARVASTPREYGPRTRSVYSDLGFMILGAWIERAAGRTLSDLFRDRVAYPLGLDDPVRPQLGFRPLVAGRAIAAADERRVAPTEVYARGLHPEGTPSHLPVREAARYAHDEVHDDNAWVMGGVAGHAGLFGTAEGVLEVARAWLAALVPGMDRDVRDRFWRPSQVPGSTRRLGWDGPEPDGSGSTGTELSARAVGHTGYTGTSLWIDPEGDRIFVLLSNAVHPTRRPEVIRAFRRRFHAAAAKL